MFIANTIEAIRQEVARLRRSQPGISIGFVPTMGALHEGHLSLMRAAQRAGDAVVVSIFVNPAQFGPDEDYLAYPRVIDADLALCESVGVAAVFNPLAGEMYTSECLTSVSVEKLTEHLCGPHRPGHFSGVALIVAKLFNIIGPDRAYFGMKDYQQLAVVRQLVQDLNMPVEVAACPIVRESDGLAMSSRNAYLSEAQRSQAAALHACLAAMRDEIASGQGDAATMVRNARKRLEASGPCRIDYVELVNPRTLQPVMKVENQVLGAMAVWIGSCRLIDNMLMDAGDGGV